MIKSTQKFIKERKGWKKGSNVQVFSNRYQIWCHGVINEVDGDMLMVFYSNNETTSFSKKLSRWSAEIRATQQLSGKMRRYDIGTKVKIWSVHNQCWMMGEITDVMQICEVVNVRYGDHEKLVPIDSNHLKLLTWDNEDNNRHCRNNAIEVIHPRPQLKLESYR